MRNANNRVVAGVISNFTHNFMHNSSLVVPIKHSTVVNSLVVYNNTDTDCIAILVTNAVNPLDRIATCHQNIVQQSAIETKINKKMFLLGYQSDV